MRSIILIRELILAFSYFILAKAQSTLFSILGTKINNRFFKFLKSFYKVPFGLSKIAYTTTAQ